MLIFLIIEKELRTFGYDLLLVSQAATTARRHQAHDIDLTYSREPGDHLGLAI
jgi:hypothetical protein